MLMLAMLVIIKVNTRIMQVRSRTLKMKPLPKFADNIVEVKHKSFGKLMIHPHGR